MKRAREKAAKAIADLPRECADLDWFNEEEMVEKTMPILREQQLAFGRRVLEDAARRMGIPGPFDDDDQRTLEKLLDEEGA